MLSFHQLGLQTTQICKQRIANRIGERGLGIWILNLTVEFHKKPAYRIFFYKAVAKFSSERGTYRAFHAFMVHLRKFGRPDMFQLSTFQGRTRIDMFYKRGFVSILL
jgi:hypothetical protein